MKFNWKAAVLTMLWMLIGLAIMGSIVGLTLIIMLSFGPGWGIGFLLTVLIVGFGVLTGYTEGT